MDDRNAANVGLGTYGLFQASPALLSRALELGIRRFDTAPNYWAGKAERAIGSMCDSCDLKIRNEIYVTTKVGYTVLDDDVMSKEEIGKHCLDPTYIRRRVIASRELLGSCPKVGLFLHNPEVLFQNHSRREAFSRLRIAIEVLEELHAERVVDSLGISTWNGFEEAFSLGEILEISDSIAPAGMSGFKLIQLPINLIRCGVAAEAVLKSHGALHVAKQRGLTVYSSSPFARGLLPDALPDEVADFLGGELSKESVCLLFLVHLGYIDTILLGTGRPDRLTRLHAISKQSGLDENRIREFLLLMEKND